MTNLLWFTDEDIHLKNNFMDGTIENLDILSLSKAMFPKNTQALSAEQLCTLFSTDKGIIQKRQDVIKDLLQRPELLTLFENLVEKIISWEKLFALPDLGDDPEDISAFDSLDSFSIAQIFIKLIKNMHELLCCSTPIVSDGINALAQKTDEIYSGSSFNKLVDEWGKRMSGLGMSKSLTFCFRLDEYFNLTHIKLLDVNRRKYVDPGKKIPDTIEGLTNVDTLHKGLIAILGKITGLETALDFNYDLGDKDNTADLKKTIANLAALSAGESPKRVRDYLKLNTRWIINMKTELLFYCGAVRFINKLKELKADYCFPTPGDFNGKQLLTTKLYHPLLLFYGKSRNEIIDNDVRLSSKGEFAMLTGANQGGKTTFLRSIGLAQFMMQLGLPVAAANFKADLVDNIYTVFSVKEENVSTKQGKLGQELMRIANIGEQLTPNTMLLFNEPMSGTSTAETLIISREVLCAIKLIGARGIWVTHLHDLAADVNRLNSVVDGITLKNMIAVVDHNEDGTTPTYHIIEADPEMTSYAYDVVKRYGLKLN